MTLFADAGYFRGAADGATGRATRTHEVRARAESFTSVCDSESLPTDTSGGFVSLAGSGSRLLGYQQL